MGDESAVERREIFESQFKKWKRSVRIAIALSLITMVLFVVAIVFCVLDCMSGFCLVTSADVAILAGLLALAGLSNFMRVRLDIQSDIMMVFFKIYDAQSKKSKRVKSDARRS